MAVFEGFLRLRIFKNNQIFITTIDISAAGCIKSPTLAAVVAIQAAAPDPSELFMFFSK